MSLSVPDTGRRRCVVLISYFEAGENLVRSLLSLDGAEPIDVVVVDDGSRRLPAWEVLRDYPGPARVKLIKLPSNQGVEHAANAGLAFVKGKYQYVARLDCGDLCVDDRIAAQVRYLDEHPNCGAVGTWADFVTPSGEFLYTLRHPTDSTSIRRRMFINMAFIHSSLMFRSSALEAVGSYPVDRPAAEDFGLLWRMVEQFETANIPRPLIRYVVDPASISSTRRQEQMRSRIAILLEHFRLRPVAIYGLARAGLQLATARWLTTELNRRREHLRRS